MTQEQNMPAPSKGMETLIGKVVAEPDFRQQMVDNPEQALRSAGIYDELTEEERQAVLSSSREEREQLMQQLADRTSPGCWFATTIHTGNWW